MGHAGTKTWTASMPILWGVLCAVVAIAADVPSTPDAHPEWDGTVLMVTSGETVAIGKDNQLEMVRLYGLSSPELSNYFHELSKKAITDLVLNKKVRVKVQGKDEFARLVASLYSDGGTYVNAELLKSGMAWRSTKHGGNDPALDQAESEAQQKGLGLWSVWQGKVNRLVDEDLLDIERAGKPQKVRLYGIEFPKKALQYHRLAKRTASDILLDASVKVVTKGKDAKDIPTVLLYGENGECLNVKLVRMGAAICSRPEASHMEDFSLAETHARLNSLGVWDAATGGGAPDGASAASEKLQAGKTGRTGAGTGVKDDSEADDDAAGPGSSSETASTRRGRTTVILGSPHGPAPTPTPSAGDTKAAAPQKPAGSSGTPSARTQAGSKGFVRGK
ncbi:MAG: thermonuclease family protein [Thermodesulfobacteriota bacterium]